jgi:cyclase
MRHVSSAVIALTLAALPSLAQEDFSKVEVTAAKVAGNVYMLKGAGGNIGASVGDDGIVIVDDEFAPLAPKIRAALAGITDKPVRFVINTHWHGDHTGAISPSGKPRRSSPTRTFASVSRTEAACWAEPSSPLPRGRCR